MKFLKKLLILALIVGAFYGGYIYRAKTMEKELNLDTETESLNSKKSSENNGLDEKPAEQVSASATPADGSENKQDQKSQKDLIVGAWSYSSMVDKNGNAVSPKDVKGDGELIGLLFKALSSGANAEFTSAGKLKISFISVDYAFDSASTISISGGMLPQSFSGVPVKVTENNLNITVGGYTLIMKRA